MGGLCNTIMGATLPFSTVKFVGLIFWFYLCIYSVYRSDNSPLVTDKYRYLSNIAALLVGPLLLILLFIVDTVKELHYGRLELINLPRHVLDGILGRHERKSGRVGDKIPPIELMDTAGRRFKDVYEHIGSAQDHQIQERTEQMILKGIQGRASDILIDPNTEGGTYTIRFRVDGFLRVFDQPAAAVCNAMINSLKAVSGMDIAEKRRPQDGAFMAKVPDGQVYFRMASSGVIGGEKLSLRVMDQTLGLLTLDEIGLTGNQVARLGKIIQQPSGMVLVCGPTGSGKTTTLYAMLRAIDFSQRNVVTIEDPVEHLMPSISQIEVNAKAGVTFANSLRSILRQDPDVICVGEIRDSETAAMAVQAAQTGHLVLATLHAGSNIAALVRMMDLGVRPLLLASALAVVISQRLIRKLCDSCRGPAELSASQMEFCVKNSVDKNKIFQANGCGMCGGTGYLGRTAIIDILYMDDQMKTLLCNQTLSPGDLKQKGDREFYATLRREGLKKVMAGTTTLSEIKRITSTVA